MYGVGAGNGAGVGDGVGIGVGTGVVVGEGVPLVVWAGHTTFAPPLMMLPLQLSYYDDCNVGVDMTTYMARCVSLTVQ